MHIQGAMVWIFLLTSQLYILLPVSYVSKKGEYHFTSKKTKIKTSTKISAYMSPLLADGFDFPAGNKQNIFQYKGRWGQDREGWIVTCGHCGKEKYGIYTGEVWDAVEGSDCDLNELVFSIARGVVKTIETDPQVGKSIQIEHIYLENGKIDTIYSVYKNLNPIDNSIPIAIGDTLSKGQAIGSIGNKENSIPVYLHIELRKKSIRDLGLYFQTDTLSDAWKAQHFLEVTDFINSHRKVTHPCSSERLLIAIKEDYKLYYIEEGKITDTLEIAVGQDPEFPKIRKGDNRTPEGEYLITQKARGPFQGKTGDYFGLRWIRINYPNYYDAEAGLRNKFINEETKNLIQEAILNNEKPPQDTNLGGEMGIHGWKGEWDPKGHRNFTWGGISVNNSELVVLYNKVKVGDQLIIAD